MPLLSCIGSIVAAVLAVVVSAVASCVGASAAAVVELSAAAGASVLLLAGVCVVLWPRGSSNVGGCGCDADDAGCCLMCVDGGDLGDGGLIVLGSRCSGVRCIAQCCVCIGVSRVVCAVAAFVDPGTIWKHMSLT